MLLSYSAVEIYSVRLGGSRRERACKVYCDGQGYSLESHKTCYRRGISTWQRPGNVPECMQQRRCPAVMQCRSQRGAPELFDRCSCDINAKLSGPTPHSMCGIKKCRWRGNRIYESRDPTNVVWYIRRGHRLGSAAAVLRVASLVHYGLVILTLGIVPRSSITGQRGEYSVVCRN